MEEENNKINGEGESLSSETIQTWDDQEENKKVFTLEEVEAMRKEMQSNSERWVQKVLSEQKLYKQSLKEIAKIWENENRLIEIAEENPKLAEIILNDFFWWESLEDYKDRIGYIEDYSDPKILNAKIKKEAEKITQNNLINEQKKSFIDKLQMSEEEIKNFEESFEELKSLKSFSTKDLIKQFEKAYRLSNDNDEALKKLRTQEVIAKTMSTWENKTTNWKKEDKNSLENQIASFKKKHYI